MELFENIKEKILEFWENSTGFIKTLSLIVAFLIISAIIAIPFSITVTKKKNTYIPHEKDFVKTKEFFKPQDVPLTLDYYPERPADKEWSKEDSQEWFTLPDQNYVNALGQANDKIVNDITGAAP